MMKKTTIDYSSHSLYEVFRELYAASFPVFEQRTEEQQQIALRSVNYHLVASVDNGLFIGFIAFRECVVYVYIGHCAVSRDIRGEGYGSRLLADFIAANSKTVLLEIDPPTDEVSKARLAFYGKCGFHENFFTHFHPPYRDGFKHIPLSY